MATNELDEPEEFKTTYNNPKEAKEFVNKIIKLVDSFVANVTGYHRYKQEKACGEFVQKYIKELKQLDDYFNDADPKLILDLIDDKMCEVLRKPEPDHHTIKLQTSEEKIPTGHGTLQELVHEKPTPTLSDEGQAAVVQLFANLQHAHEYSVKVAKAVTQLGTVATPEHFCFIMR